MPDINLVNLIGRQQLSVSPFYQEIMNEGRVEASRAHTLAILEYRFGSDVAAQVTGVVKAMEDAGELDRLFHVAMYCTDIEEFRQALEPTGPRWTAARPRRPSRRRR
jgi:hypothetical protein